MNDLCISICYNVFDVMLLTCDMFLFGPTVIKLTTVKSRVTTPGVVNSFHEKEVGGRNPNRESHVNNL